MNVLEEMKRMVEEFVIESEEFIRRMKENDRKMEQEHREMMRIDWPIRQELGTSKQQHKYYQTWIIQVYMQR